MNQPLLHPRTAQDITRYIAAPQMPLLIIGEPGSGKSYAAHYLASRLLPEGTLLQQPHLIILQKPDDKRVIPIETIRSMLHGISLKLSGSDAVERVVLIDGGEHLNVEGQNILLKAIEEPPEGCTFIITATSEDALLPTVRSRCQTLEIRPIPYDLCVDFFGSAYTPAALKSAWHLSGGTAGLMIAMLAEDDNHPLKKAVDEAKRLLGNDRFEKLAAVDILSKQPTQLMQLLIALQKILTVLHHQSIQKGKDATLYTSRRQAVVDAEAQLKVQASTKLVLTNLMLNL